MRRTVRQHRDVGAGAVTPPRALPPPVRLSPSTLDAVRAVQQHYAHRLASLRRHEPPPADADADHDEPQR